MSSPTLKKEKRMQVIMQDLLTSVPAQLLRTILQKALALSHNTQSNGPVNVIKKPEFSCLRLSFCASERKQVQMYPATINVTMQVTAELRNRSDFVQKVPVLSL